MVSVRRRVEDLRGAPCAMYRARMGDAGLGLGMAGHRLLWGREGEDLWRRYGL